MSGRPCKTFRRRSGVMQHRRVSIRLVFVPFAQTTQETPCINCSFFVPSLRLGIRTIGASEIAKLRAQNSGYRLVCVAGILWSCISARFHPFLCFYHQTILPAVQHGHSSCIPDLMNQLQLLDRYWVTGYDGYGMHILLLGQEHIHRFSLNA